MKKLIYLPLAMIMTLSLTACGSDDEEARVVEPTATGTMTDSEGNEYGWVRIDGLDWTTSNARNGASMCDISYVTAWGWEDYVFSTSECERLNGEYIPANGNLMSYSEALASAPEGWRLPTDEDWKALERALGMKNADATGWRGNGHGEILRNADSAPNLGLTLGGGIMYMSFDNTACRVSFGYEKERGYYWTADVDKSSQDTQKVFIRKIMYGTGGVERISVETTDRYCSVRWVRDAK